MAFAKWLRWKMLQTCHLACIEDDNERETFIQRVGAVTNDTEYLRPATAEVRARKVSDTLPPRLGGGFHSVPVACSNTSGIGRSNGGAVSFTMPLVSQIDGGQRMQHKIREVAAVLVLAASMPRVLTEPPSIQSDRHIRRLYYWVFGPGFLFHYIAPGFYCPESEVKDRCLFDGPEGKEVRRRGREAVGAELLAAE